MLIQRKYYPYYVTNSLLALLPVSFIAGNLILNANIVILILASLALYKLDIFKRKLSTIDKLVIIFFFYTSLNGFFNNFLNFNFSNIPYDNIVLIKSLAFLRFFFLYFTIKYLILNNIINYKFLFFIFGCCSLFVSIDILIQFSFGKDIFGYAPSGRRLSGPFGDELVAGSFIQRFFIFIIFFIVIFFKNQNKKIINLFFFSTLILILIGILLSGNRIPVLMLIIMLCLIFVYEKNLRKNLGLVFLCFFLALSFLILEKSKFRPHYKSFIVKSVEIVDYVKQRLIYGEVKVKNVYIKEIESGILTWERNKLFGGGINSFRWNCNSVDRSKMLSFVSKRGEVNCNNHPHNYYLEIAAELGIVGLIFVLSIFITIIYHSINKLHFSGKRNEKFEFLKVFFILFIVEIFPFKTTGSFFSTFNANFIFIILPFVVGLIEYKNNKS